ncbi:hypothetical protein [Streptomyces lincolnensis]|uniref:hypothetical protein n=1 Tax=Streptomyces lincolnensis TaxID=1915 RepID=UPI0037CD978B
MEDHGRGEYDEFALHGGVAVERLAKAALVKKNPLYLVEMRNGNSDMLLHFGGDLEMDAEKVRTVGANEALKRLRRMGVLPLDPQLDLLIELRNGTAHTTVGGDQARALLPTLAETVTILLRDVGMSFEHFWGRWSSAVHVAIDKHRGEVQRDVEVRIKQARHLFEDRFKGLPEEVKERALQRPENVVRAITIKNSNSLLALISTVRCPACDTQAQVKLVPLSEEPVGAELQPEALACRLCGLQLDSPEEIEAAGIEEAAFVLPPNIAVTWRADDAANAEPNATL